MTQEHKQLLLKDLCARLPYGVIVDPVDCGKAILIGIKDGGLLLFDTIHNEEYDKPWDIEYCKPYLRPMSSMTEEEIEELKSFYDAENVTNESICFLEGGTLEEYEAEIPFIFCYNIVVWLLEHHFDYRGLIPLGLAIEVTEDNNPYKR